MLSREEQLKNAPLQILRTLFGRTICRRLLQSEKAYSPKKNSYASLLWSSMHSKELHFEKAYFFICCSEGEKETDFNFLQLANALIPMATAPIADTLSRPVQPSKALSSMFFTPFGILIFFSFLQPQKARSPIFLYFPAK